MTASLPTLNVITPVSRPENLPAILKNLSQVGHLNIKWFTIFDPLVASSADEWSSLVHPTAPSPELPDFPVEVAVAGTQGGWGGSKRSYAISLINEGWCYFLDDDNLMHPNFEKAFRRGMAERPDAQVIVFDQVRKDETMRLQAAPEFMRGCHFDTGQFVMKRSLIGAVEYAPTESPWSTIWPDVGVGDWNFIKKFWETEPGQFHFISEVGAYYNALRE